jgi:hypothetical protein
MFENTVHTLLPPHYALIALGSLFGHHLPFRKGIGYTIRSDEHCSLAH